MTLAVPPIESIPRDGEGPVFREPWEAQAFALVVQLHQRGLFTWKEWADTLSAEIRAVGERGEGRIDLTHGRDSNHVVPSSPRMR